MNKKNFKSIFEKDIAASLQKKKIKFEYEPEAFAIKIEKNYWPDYRITTKSGKTFLLETKGFLDADSKEKLLAFKKDYPSEDLRILFQADNYLHKLTKRARKRRIDKSKEGGKVRDREKYSDWATKHGFLFAVGRIPEEWINE